MAIITWLGRALARAQVTTITISGTWAGADTATVTINSKSLILTVGTDTSTTQIATAIKEMWNGDTQTGTGDHTFSQTGDNVAEFNEVTAESSGAVITLTGDTAGLPYTVTVSESTAGSGAVGSPSITTEATGPNDANDANNYSGGALPSNGDTLNLENSDVPILYHLDQLSSVQLTKINKFATYTAAVGLPKTNPAGYPEYRPQYFQIGADELEYGIGEGDESGRFKLDYGSSPCNVQIHRTGASIEQGVPAVLLKDSQSSADGTVEIVSGSLGLAFFWWRCCQGRKRECQHRGRVCRGRSSDDQCLENRWNVRGKRNVPRYSAPWR